MRHLTRQSIWAGAAALGLAACAPLPPEDPPPTERELLLEVLGPIAATGQDLSTVYLRPEDNCYWYTYQGPIETTELPLRNATGALICAQDAPALADAGDGAQAEG